MEDWVCNAPPILAKLKEADPCFLFWSQRESESERVEDMTIVGSSYAIQL
jgi:hypothetical protein